MTHTLTYIIGGTSGMGLATARLLGQDGGIVAIVGRSADKLAAAADAVNAAGGTAETIEADITDPASVGALIARIDAETRPITGLVNAAGSFFPKPFLEHESKDYDIYATLNRGTFFVTQAVARNMKAQGGGAIVNIGSMWAKQAIKATPSSAYSMAKAGLHSLTQHLAMELGPFGIRVNAVSPAVVVSVAPMRQVNRLVSFMWVPIVR